MKRILQIVAGVLAAVVLTACGGRGGSNEGTNGENVTGIGGTTENDTVMAAAFSEQNLDLSSALGMQYVEGRLYYSTMQKNPDTEKTIHTIYCMEESGKPQKMLSLDEGQTLYGHTADGDGNLYLFIVDGGTCFQQKLDPEQGEVYRTEEGGQTWAEELADDVIISYKGEVCMLTGKGTLLIWDQDGRLTQSMKAEWYQENMSSVDFGLVNAGEEGVFVYHFTGGRLSVQKVDTENGRLAPDILISMPDVEEASSNQNWCELFSGYEKGIYLAGEKSLWCWDASSEESEELFGWGDAYVNIPRDFLCLAAGCRDGSILLLTYDMFLGVSEQVKVAARDMSELTERQEITIGSLRGYEYPEDTVISFNREQNRYTLTKQEYQSKEELQMALLQGEAADILCLDGLTVEELAALGVLEDMTDYLASSEQIHEEDLLPAVRESCTVNGSIRCLYDSFLLQVMVMEKGHSVNGGITTEDFLGLTDSQQDTYLLNFSEMMSFDTVLGRILLSDMDSFVDWESRTCSFDSEAFIRLLEGTAALKVPASGSLGEERQEYLTNELNLPDRMQNGEFMVYCGFLYNMENYVNMDNAFGKFADIAGYPTQTGEPRYLMASNNMLGINSASEQKEGAWAFIEYTLLNGVDETDPSASFSVLTEKFEKQLYPEDSDGVYANDYLGEKSHVGLTPPTEEQVSKMREMVDNAVWKGSGEYRDILRIIYEETEYFFAGDKTAEEAADVIQSKVSILMSEG